MPSEPSLAESSTPASYREFPAPPSLRAYVECFWTLDCSPADHPLVLPDGCMDLLTFPGTDGQPGPGEARVVGSMTRATVSRNPVGPIAAVRFRPGGGAALLGLHGPEFLDRSVSWEEVATNTGPRPSSDAQASGALHGLRHQLRARLPSVTGSAHKAAKLAQACLQAPHLRIGELAKRLGLTRQHLRRRVVVATGLSPKQLTRIGRLRRLTDRMAAGVAPDVRLALDSGYCDQAHMINEFRALVGLSPGAYWRQRERPEAALALGS